MAVSVTGARARSAVSSARQQHGQKGRTDGLEQQHHSAGRADERRTGHIGKRTGEERNKQRQQVCRASNSLALQTEGRAGTSRPDELIHWCEDS